MSREPLVHWGFLISIIKMPVCKVVLVTINFPWFGKIFLDGLYLVNRLSKIFFSKTENDL